MSKEDPLSLLESTSQALYNSTQARNQKFRTLSTEEVTDFSSVKAKRRGSTEMMRSSPIYWPQER